MPSYTDYPKAASNNAKKAIEWRDKYGRDVVKGGTRVGWARANQLANREPISYDTVKRMSAFNRHRKNAEVDPKYKSEPWRDNGYIAWLIWGGTEGVDWAIRKVKQVEESKNMATTHKCIHANLNEHDDALEMFVTGEIGWDMTGEDFIKELAYINKHYKEKKKKMYIYSGGGSLIDAIAIYDYIKATGTKIDIYGFGMVGSAATIIQAAGTKKYLGENSDYFIHRAFYSGYGEVSEEMQAELDRKNEQIINIYKSITGLGKDKIRELLDAGDKQKCMSAKEAASYGFIDEVIKTNSIKNTYDKLINYYKPERNMSILNTLRNFFINTPAEQLADMEKEILNEAQALEQPKTEVEAVVETPEVETEATTEVEATVETTEVEETVEEVVNTEMVELTQKLEAETTAKEELAQTVTDLTAKLEELSKKFENLATEKAEQKLEESTEVETTNELTIEANKKKTNNIITTERGSLAKAFAKFAVTTNAQRTKKDLLK